MERTLSVQRLTDAKALRALAHPLRLDLMEALALHGALTATQAADIVGESPANCSWHLRQLAKYGYLEEVPGTTGRQRPWRRVAGGLEWAETDPDPEVEQASHNLTDVLIDRQVDRVKKARARRQPEGWEETPMATQVMTWLTLEEAEALNKQIGDLICQFPERATDPAARPAGARPVRMLALGVADDSLDPDFTN